MNFFFFNDTATTEIYTLSLHDALPICVQAPPVAHAREEPPITVSPYGLAAVCINFLLDARRVPPAVGEPRLRTGDRKSNTSELQSRQYLVCRLLLEKKNIHTLSHASVT